MLLIQLNKLVQNFFGLGALCKLFFTIAVMGPQVIYMIMTVHSNSVSTVKYICQRSSLLIISNLRIGLENRYGGVLGTTTICYANEILLHFPFFYSNAA